MTKNNIRTIEQSRVSLKLQVIATLAGICAAVVVPQLLHAIGAVTGLNTALGETFLPMHLPIILVGLMAGPYAGALAGLFGPLVSHLTTGMPLVTMLPFMMLELCIYGLTAGLLRNVRMYTVAKVLLVQIAGRAVRAVAILCSVYVLSNQAIGVSVIWKSIATGVPGLILQWTLLPVIVYMIEKREADEQ